MKIKSQDARNKVLGIIVVLVPFCCVILPMFMPLLSMPANVLPCGSEDGAMLPPALCIGGVNVLPCAGSEDGAMLPPPFCIGGVNVLPCGSEDGVMLPPPFCIGGVYVIPCGSEDGDIPACISCMVLSL